MSDALEPKKRSIKILIVDDEDIVLSIARDTLEDAGYEVDIAESGETALEKLKAGFFDFVLTDIRMPGINGLELAQRARELIPSIGILFMTGYANLDTAKDAIKEGAYDYIMKPFEIQELRKAVGNAIDKKKNDTEKTLNNELNRLSDLNQLMYAVNDRQSLMRLSLGFAMMQGNTDMGCIIFQSEAHSQMDIITTDSGDSSELISDSAPWDGKHLERDFDPHNAPIVLSTLKDHPLYEKIKSSSVADLLVPDWFTDQTRMVQIALKRGKKIYGFLILGYPQDSNQLKESKLKFLTITASQITISLENIILLEESRSAYSKLADLQDQTLELERMATKGQMSAEIGHELNNFLGVMMGNLSLMKHHMQEKNYSELNRYVDATLQNAEKIRDFTDDLMDFTKIQSKFEECYVCRLVSDVVDQLRAQKRFTNIDLEFTPPKNWVKMMADCGQLQQLLYNLMNNASDAIAEATDKRQGQIRIDLTSDRKQDKFTLSIKDNGVGFKTEKLSQAFSQRFTTKDTGHGFGLLVSKRIIENHQGSLKIDSIPDSGTCIEIEFPVNLNIKSAVSEPS